MSKIRFILFLAISITIISAIIWGVGGSDIRGLSLKNTVFYLSVLILIVVNLSERDLLIKKIPSFFPLSLFFLIGASSLLYAGLFSDGVKLDRLESLVEFKAKLLDPIFLYIAGAIIFRSARQSSSALRLLVAIFSLLNIVALLSFFSGINFLGRDVLSHSGQRFSSFGPIANQGAYALAFLAPIIYYFLNRTNSIVIKAFYLTMVLSCLSGIMLTGSRGAYLLVPLQVIGISMLTKNVRLLIFSILGGFVVFGFILASNSSFLINVLNRMSIFQAANLREVSSGRTMIWGGILEYMYNEPLAIVTGVGWGTYRAHIRGVLGSSPAAHNYYLKIWLELGTVGLGILITGIYVYIYKFAKLVRKPNPLFFQCAACAYFALFWNTMLASLESFLLYYAWFSGLITNYAINLSDKETI
ncbi:MAG: hypothetical protein CSA23_04280 [Deltaproteobacteria bacterium]|nr:MAG: hypothetical protein CSA23_04280 [Deltaproteobacteria bacterium]